MAGKERPENKGADMESSGELNELRQKVDRLERLCNRLYQEEDLLNTHIPKLMDTLIEYWQRLGSYRETMQTLISIYRGEVGNIDKELQEHFKAHSDKKRNTTKYTIK